MKNKKVFLCLFLSLPFIPIQSGIIQNISITGFFKKHPSLCITIGSLSSIPIIYKYLQFKFAREAEKQELKNAIISTLSSQGSNKEAMQTILAKASENLSKELAEAIRTTSPFSPTIRNHRIQELINIANNI